MFPLCFFSSGGISFLFVYKTLRPFFAHRSSVLINQILHDYRMYLSNGSTSKIAIQNRLLFCYYMILFWRKHTLVTIHWTVPLCLNVMSKHDVKIVFQNSETNAVQKLWYPNWDPRECLTPRHRGTMTPWQTLITHTYITIHRNYVKLAKAYTHASIAWNNMVTNLRWHKYFG